MYDDKGRISSTAFSNTPPTSAPLQDVGGREQIKRSGSTLRQLLGEPESANNSDVAEGDISWAERYLGEHAAGSQCSLASTAPVETPKDFLFTDDPCLTKLTMPNATFSSDISQELSINYPVISSMEVEISGTSETVELELDTVSFVEATPKTVEPKTPMRASEVFGFLTERRKSILERQKSQRALAAPPLPYVSLNPSTDNVTNTPHPNHSSPDTSDTSIMTSSAQIHTATVTKLTPVLNPLTPSTDNLNIMRSPSTLTCNTSPYLPSPSTRVHLTGDSQSTVATSSSKIPRGPRPLPATPSSSRVNVQNPSMPRTGTRIPKHVSTGTQDPFTPVRARQQRRVVSRASSVASNDDIENQGVRLPVPKKSRKSERGAAQRDKENSPPSVPLRTIFDKRYPNLMKGEPPSPASSSELSPIAKDMMLNLRKQRMRARDEPRLSISRSSRRNS
ncbi:hypothetical protein EW026_g3890 [Hermanssonia centrifuga]|uniref:Uncharacterized protein n=1 Tax=Hermanssonia centrifuga TaxID=98765 RepID=A0A4S4KJW8_9APHY|nr:hypothetical protein EW026_g3890 [Hermanssonia centrifuga]